MHIFSLTISSPLPEARPLARLLLDESVEVRFSTQIPIGFGACQIDWESANHPENIVRTLRHAEVQARSHIELRAGARVLFEGEVVELSGTGPNPTSLTANGYGASANADAPFSSLDAVTQLTSGEALQSVLSQVAPLLRLGDADQFRNPGVGPLVLAEFDGMMAGEIVDQIVKLGGNDTAIWDFAVWERQTVHLLPRSAPARPHYRVPLDDTVEWTENVEDVYGRVKVTYEDWTTGSKSETPVYEDPTFVERFGRWRSITVEGGRLSQTAAQQFAQAYLERVRDASVTYRIARWAKTLRSNHVTERWVETDLGEPIAPWLVRAGEWVVVGDDEPMMILATDFAMNSGDLMIEVGTGEVDFVESYRYVEETVRALRRKINPVTGGKER